MRAELLGLLQECARPHRLRWLWLRDRSVVQRQIGPDGDCFWLTVGGGHNLGLPDELEFQGMAEHMDVMLGRVSAPDAMEFLKAGGAPAGGLVMQMLMMGPEAEGGTPKVRSVMLLFRNDTGKGFHITLDGGRRDLELPVLVWHGATERAA